MVTLEIHLWNYFSMSISFFSTWEPKTVLEVWSQKCQIEGRGITCSLDDGCTFTETVRDVLNTLLTFSQLAVNQDPKLLFCRTAT